MTVVAPIINQLSPPIVSEHLQLPYFFERLLYTTNAVHRMWTLHRFHRNIYEDTSHFHQYVAGCTLNIVAGHHSYLRIAARCVMIAERSLAALRIKEDLAHEAYRFIHCLRGSYAALDEEEAGAIAFSEQEQISPCIKNELHKVAHHTREYFHQLWLTAKALCVASFCYSMSLIDLMQAFSSSQEITIDSINELLVNGASVAQHLSSDEDLLQHFITQEGIIETILVAMGAERAREQMHSLREHCANGLANITHAVETGTSLVERVQNCFDGEAISGGAHQLIHTTTGQSVRVLLPRSNTP